jgi:hypothetical protein
VFSSSLDSFIYCMTSMAILFKPMDVMAWHFELRISFI